MGSILDRIVLGITALVLVGVGIAATVTTVTFYGGYDIALDGSIELANELRALGGVLLLAGLVIGAGAVRSRWIFPAAIVAATVMLGLALGRVGSAIVDGMPAASVITAGVIELVLGSASVLVAVKNRPRD
jgi:hypothetical protein